jgi:TatA/E family protein of Tat protein translocase
MNFLGMGPMELMVILVLALIVFGPGKLPEIAGQVGRAVRDFRRTTSELSSEFNRTLSLELEERKASEAPPAAAAAPVAPYESTAAPGAAVAEAGAPVAPPAEPSEAPPIVAAAPAVTTNGTAEDTASASPAQSDSTTAPAGGSKRRTFDADLAPPY